MRKYVFVASNEWPNWGGSELLWSLAAERMARRGDEVRVSVAGFIKGHPHMERLEAAGCQVHYRAGFPPLVNRVGRRFLKLPDYKQTEFLPMTKGADLVVVSQGSVGDGMAFMEWSRAAGLKYTAIVQGASDVWWPEDGFAEKLATVYEGAARSYYVSQATLDACRSQFATALPGGKVIRNPYNVRYDAQVPWPGDSREEMLLACVGRIDGAAKGHDLLIRSFSLPYWRGRKVRVSVVGKGNTVRVLTTMARNLGVTNVEFTGPSGNIEEVWSKHHALVLPSRFEGMPLVIVEAMLCGRACIATDVGGNRELIQDGVNGFIARAATVEFWDEAMNRAWENRARLKEMGETAAADVRKWVSSDPVGDFVNDLDSLVNGGKS